MAMSLPAVRSAALSQEPVQDVKLLKDLARATVPNAWKFAETSLPAPTLELFKESPRPVNRYLLVLASVKTPNWKPGEALGTLRRAGCADRNERRKKLGSTPNQVPGPMSPHRDTHQVDAMAVDLTLSHPFLQHGQKQSAATTRLRTWAPPTFLPRTLRGKNLGLDLPLE